MHRTFCVFKPPFVELVLHLFIWLTTEAVSLKKHWNATQQPSMFLLALANIFTVINSILCLTLLKCFPCLSQLYQSADSSFDKGSDTPTTDAAALSVLFCSQRRQQTETGSVIINSISFCPHWPFTCSVFLRFISRADTLFRLCEGRFLAVMYY